MKITRRFHLWWMDNWMKLMVWGLVSSGLVLMVVGLYFLFFKLESFYLILNLAQLPVNIYMSFLGALVFVFMYSRLFSSSLGGINRKTQVKTELVNVKFSDVIGLESAKKEAMEVVELLRDRAKLKAIGGKIIKGIMLFGGPGTGKTLLAKAIATEVGVPFLSMSGAEFVEIFVGVGGSRVRQLFARARILAETYGACIIFIDEIDALGRRRTFNSFGGQEGDVTLNQLLVEMDGLNEQQPIVVIGATNSDESILDPALMRPGRFDRKLFIDKPNLEERVETFRYYMKKVKVDPSVDIGRLARRCVGKSPADIMNIVKESALIATRNKRAMVSYKDISQAIERIDLGAARKLTMTAAEREATAYHEVGHLMCVYQLHPTDDVFKVSIISRGGTLGVVWHNPREEQHSERKDGLIADIKVSLAGYVAEKIKYGVTTTGVSQDFTNAMRIAHAMVWRFGMGESGHIGNFAAIPESQLSGDLKDALNKEVHAILQSCAKEVESFLRADWTIVERFVQELLKKDELEYDEVHAIFAEFGKARNQIPIETIHPDDAKYLPPPPPAGGPPPLPPA